MRDAAKARPAWSGPSPASSQCVETPAPGRRAPTAGYRCTWPSGARWLRNAFPARGARHGCRVAAGRCVCRSGVVDLDVQDGAVAVVWSAVLVAAVTGGQPQAPGRARLDGT